jgi:hypothetical protein
MPAPVPVPVPDQCLAPSRSVDGPVPAATYSRMFAGLPPFTCDEALLLALGGAGGICDASPLALGGGDDAVGVAAGWPVFGQLVAHDLTADRSPLSVRADVAALENFRTPRANLECLYGAGPTGAPYLYDRDDPARFLCSRHDLPRNAQGLALTGDPRNDVHQLMSQLHLALLHVHNGLVDRLRAAGADEARVFAGAQRETTWHYQWIVLHEFLPLLVGRARMDALLAGGPRWYVPGTAPTIPLEFADAAYRYGHSQIRHAYRLNARHAPVPLFPDLVGFGPLPDDHHIDWRELFDFAGAAPAQRARKIDGRLAASLIQLPRAISGEDPTSPYDSLAVRDLERGLGTALPSGEAIAATLGVPALSAEQTGMAEAGWDGETPLWLYVLKEAEALEDGERLGPVGGTIVGEVLVGIIDADPGSFRAAEPAWRPTLAARDGTFGIADLLLFADQVRGGAPL